MAPQYEFDEPGFLQRYGFVIGIGAVAAAVAALLLVHRTGRPPAREIRPPDVVMVRPIPQQPTPPPPEPPKEIVQKMIEQSPMDKPEDKPEEAPKDAAPAITTNVTGTGSDAFGLAAGGGGETGAAEAGAPTAVLGGMRRRCRG